MSLFQNIITQKHIASQYGKIKPAYELFAAYFHNTVIQENILASKEEQFQEGFLRELFVKILGYTLNPDPDFNLITERKNEKDAKKADGAIIIKGEVVGIIELKDHKTIDLKHIEMQAFGELLANQPMAGANLFPDLGDEAFIPTPVREHPLNHFLKVKEL